MKINGKKLGRGRVAPSFFPPPPPFPSSRPHIFACLSLSRHPYYLRAWNKLWRREKLGFFIKLIIHKNLYNKSCTHSQTLSFIVLYWDTLVPELSCPSCPCIVPRYPRFQFSLFFDSFFLIFPFRALYGEGFTPSAG